MVKQEIFHINKRLKSGSVRIYNFLIKTVMHKAYLDHVSNVYYMVNMWCKQTPTLVTFIIKLLYDINKISKNPNAFFLLRKKNICHICVSNYPIDLFFLVTTLKIFSSPVQTGKKRQYQVCLWNTAIHAISGKTLKTAVINTNTHIYKMKRKKKDRKKWKQIIIK